MAARHRYMKEKIGAYQELPHGRRPGQKCVPKADYPEMVRMDDEGYLKSEIGRRFGITGTRAGIIIRTYRESLK